MSHLRILNLIAFGMIALAFVIVAGKLDKSRELNRFHLEIQPQHYNAMSRYKQILEEEN